MELQFSKRVTQEDFQGEFIDVILKAAADPSLTSFAGGLPNPQSFPVEAVKEAANKVFENFGYRSLQYNAAEGLLPLREKICQRYKEQMDLDYTPDEIVITTGSQQALDII